MKARNRIPLPNQNQLSRTSLDALVQVAFINVVLLDTRFEAFIHVRALYYNIVGDTSSFHKSLYNLSRYVYTMWAIQFREFIRLRQKLSRNLAAPWPTSLYIEMMDPLLELWF